MEQLTTLDAGFLQAEDADQHVSMAIGGLAVVEGPAPDYGAILSTFAKRMSVCPRFAQRLRRRPLDIGPPEWADDPNFDLTHHVQRIAVPHPGDDAALSQLVADLMALRLHRDRPLWEIWVIEGLTDDRWAMLTKVHHCMADGIAATHMLAGLCDDGAGDGFESRIRGAKDRKSEVAPKGGFTVNPLRLLSELWNVSATIATTAARAAQEAADLAVSLLGRSPTSPLNGPISSRRRYGAACVPLDDIATVCRTFGVTINDVALSAVTESYRAMLIRRGETPLPDSLRTLVPVSMRTADALGHTDNRVSMMLPYLPVDEENPIRRLRAVHWRLNRTKSEGQAEAGNSVMSLANRIPFPLTAAAVWLLARLPQRSIATVATNVPGPRQSLQILGHKVVGVFPVPPIAMQLRTGVAMLSYADHLYFGILADYDAVPEVDELAHGIEVAVARLAARSKRRKSPADRHGLSLVHSA